MTDSEPKPNDAMPAGPTPPASPAPEPTPPAAEVAPVTPEAAPSAPAEAEAPPVATPPSAEAPPVAAEPSVEAAETDEEIVAPAKGLHWGTGRRKSSVARVRILPGDGKIVVNKRPVDQYFHHLRDQNDVLAPLELVNIRRQWDIFVNVRGGGTTGQAGAVRLGLARAIVKAYGQHEAALRNAGYLTRDARRVERKKYGHRKARRRFQFSKR